MKVCEIFTSIQGESSYAGLLCTFVRLSGCNLRCSYCDTAYAYDEGVDYAFDELVREVRMHGTPLVEITGGEPLLQEETPLLITRLLDEGFRVLVETNGSVSIGGIDPRATVIMDMKLPSSGMHDRMDVGNLALLKAGDEVKFVIADRADYERARDMVHDNRLTEKCTVLFSPSFGVLEPSVLAGWIVEDRIMVRFNLQIHKYIFGPGQRGV